MSAPTNGRVRVAISMQWDDYEALRGEAADRGDTVSGYLRNALATHRYITDRVAAGAKIVVVEGGTEREVVFR